MAYVGCFAIDRLFFLEKNLSDAYCLKLWLVLYFDVPWLGSFCDLSTRMLFLKKKLSDVLGFAIFSASMVKPGGI
jgi:hypothetical protein